MRNYNPCTLKPLTATYNQKRAKLMHNTGIEESFKRQTEQLV